MTEDVSWVLTRYVPNSDPIAFSPDRTFLAPDLVTWVRRFAGAWQASLDEVEVEAQKRITHVFYDDERNSYHPCRVDQVLLRRGVDDERDTKLSGDKIEEVYAFVVLDPVDGNEGIPAFRSGGDVLPMMGADLPRVEALTEIARSLGLGVRIEVRVWRGPYEVVKIIEPDGGPGPTDLVEISAGVVHVFLVRGEVPLWASYRLEDVVVSVEESGPGLAMLVCTPRDGGVSKSEPVPLEEAAAAVAAVERAQALTCLPWGDAFRAALAVGLDEEQAGRHADRFVEEPPLIHPSDEQITSLLLRCDAAMDQEGISHRVDDEEADALVWRWAVAMNPGLSRELDGETDG